MTNILDSLKSPEQSPPSISPPSIDDIDSPSYQERPERLDFFASYNPTEIITDPLPEIFVPPPLPSTSTAFALQPPPPPPTTHPITNTMSTTNDAKEIKLNPPTPFNGERKNLDQFLLESEMYLRMNAKVYGTDDKKIMFSLSYKFKNWIAESGVMEDRPLIERFMAALHITLRDKFLQ